MNKNFLYGLLILMLGLLIYQNYSKSDQAELEELRAKNLELMQKIEELELQLQNTQTPKSQTPAPIANFASPAPVQPSMPRPTEEPQGRVVDQIPAGAQSCQFASINSPTKLATSLTWDPQNGGEFVGDLPSGTIVEVLSTNPNIWNDYPNEHGLYVQVVEAPAAPRMVNQTGYIEMRRINHKKCNIGAEFDM